MKLYCETKQRFWKQNRSSDIYLFDIYEIFRVCDQNKVCFIIFLVSRSQLSADKRRFKMFPLLTDLSRQITTELFHHFPPLTKYRQLPIERQEQRIFNKDNGESGEREGER